MNNNIIFIYFNINRKPSVKLIKAIQIEFYDYPKKTYTAKDLDTVFVDQKDYMTLYHRNGPQEGYGSWSRYHVITRNDGNDDLPKWRGKK